MFFLKGKIFTLKNLNLLKFLFYIKFTIIIHKLFEIITQKTPGKKIYKNRKNLDKRNVFKYYCLVNNVDNIEIVYLIISFGTKAT